MLQFFLQLQSNVLGLVEKSSIGKIWLIYKFQMSFFKPNLCTWSSQGELLLLGCTPVISLITVGVTSYTSLPHFLLIGWYKQDAAQHSRMYSAVLNDKELSNLSVLGYAVWLLRFCQLSVEILPYCTILFQPIKTVFYSQFCHILSKIFSCLLVLESQKRKEN